MSYGGGGLCFLIRVPTVEYEKDVYDPRFRSTPATTPATRGLLATDLVILNHGQVKRTTSELASPSPNYHTTPHQREDV
ncbi:hypothetical protein TNCV_2349271 [Trichonephila clavipes]|uniref:Uncharacterized protein n=1 Tax=Trichonephila clavipes TaxID=2585209 RepID=A0A8X6VF67_TRICX|nr:hypothetical protein TNCV_2349271 [Trichonephila clavipes]